MGWKNVKEHYQIKHFVHLRDKGLCIGSPYINDIIVVSRDGQILKRYGWSTNDDLARYQREIEADPAKFRELLNAPDTFNKSVAVYTYEGGEILEKYCEEPGWPSVTYDGQLMYANTFSTDKATVIKRAKEDARAGIRITSISIESAEKELAKLREMLARDKAAAAKLDEDYPEIVLEAT